MPSIKSLLSELVKVEGINAAVVVGRDGFVIEGMTGGGRLDIEAVGAVISTGIGSSEVMGQSLKVGEMTQAMIEYKDGVIVMGLLGKNAILAIVADSKANLGNVRYQLKQRSPEIERAL
jgi:predicted regulator of Ras-like GTPase activity (Roadblock/LC7/MglB family)